MEILNEIIEGQEKINKRLSQLELQNRELKTLFEQHSKQKPIIQNEVTLDAKGVSEHILPELKAGIDTAKIESIGNSLIQKINNVANQIPPSIRVEGEFYGFTSWKPFTLYFFSLLFAIGVAAWLWAKNIESERTLSEFRRAVEEIRKVHPKDTKQYFY
jgi:hypothetical protein